MASKRSKKWFKKVRGSYLPNNWQGLVIHLLYTVYLIAVFVLWYTRGHHAWEFLVIVVPVIVLAAFVTQYVASKHS